MKSLKPVIIVWLAIAFILYLLFSFMAWNLNPADWHFVLRGLFAAFSVMAFFAVSSELG